MTNGDTIAAISSAVGPAARMIVRASGPDALRLGTALWCGTSLPGAGRAEPGAMHFAGLTVPGCCLYVFHGPRSYTGENLVEFHIPGNPLLARMLLDALIAAGARHADPGEFTARAYFNGRIDLTEAEGVAATILAGNEQELLAARQLLAGELARRLRPVTDLVLETLALVEVGIDFSDEEVTFLSAPEVAGRAARADAMLRDLLDQSARFERLTHEPRVVLVGRPNAGKSTLLNALAGRERAVTSPVAGTTRDVLTADVKLPRGIVQLIDAAGVNDGTKAEGEEEAEDGRRKAQRQLEEPNAIGDIEQQMQRNALRAVESADVLVLVRDATDVRTDPVLPRSPDLTVLTKSDLLPRETRPADRLSVSATTGQRLNELRDSLDRLSFGAAAGVAGGGESSSLALNARHIRAVMDARAALGRAADRAVAGDGPELVALDLRDALDALGAVTGLVTPDDLLGRIFSSFCIGK